MSVNGDVLEEFYQESLEERLIAHIAEELDIPLADAMDLYYHSRLADKIQSGAEGIQYLDYRVLAQILLDTEKALVGRYVTV